MKIALRALLLVLFAVLTGPVAGHAAPVRTENTTVELVSEARTVAPGSTFWVALKLTPRAGWHTYWRNPGDSGMPTTIAWTLPDGVTAGDIVWPAPHAVPYGPLVNYGFSDEHWLLVPITVDDTVAAGRPLGLQARADWLVCEDICIPEGTDLDLTVPVGADSAADPAQAAGFARARAALPALYQGEGAFQADDTSLFLRLPGLEAGETRFFPYKESLIRNHEDQQAVASDGALYLKVARASGRPGDTVGGVVVTDGGAYEVSLAPGAVTFPDVPSAPPLLPTISFWQAVLFALLGGVLLNLMPCVFPVLSLKALSVVKASGLSLREKRLEGLAYALGVIGSFLIIATVLIAFRAGGEAIGWGFQLQSPLVISLLAMLLFTVGLSFSGLFELAGSFTGLGQGLVDKGGAVGAFFTGMLAAIVATPCTVPFMAGALGFAMTQPAAIALAIFVALGIGMALPMLLISEIPAIGRLLPRPGPWMETFRQFLAFPVYATVIWLVWVLGQQAGMNAVAALLGALMLIPFALWLWHRRAGAKGAIRPLATGLAGLAVVAMAGLVAFADRYGDQPFVAGSGGLAHEAYTPDSLAHYRAEGLPVFVNFTAAWCITCLANERVALSSETVADYFADRGIVYLKGDWTRRDPVITETLTRFGRSGVPLYLYYPAGGDAPVVLPQILTPGIVLGALQAADGSADRLASASEERGP